MNNPEKVNGLVLISQPTRNKLDDRRLVAYKSHRKQLCKWITTLGKDPDALEGYAHDTAKNYASIIDRFCRWSWEQDGFTLDFTHGEAAAYLKAQKMEGDYSASHLHNVKLALLTYFRFKENPWDCPITISGGSSANAPRDYVTREERDKLREASLEYGSVPAYHGLSPDERQEWKLYLGRRFGKKVKDVGPSDFERANGYKYPTIVYTGLDAGFRPVEVARARTSWLDLENHRLIIPPKESSKNDAHWGVTLRDDTTEFLRRWQEEREMYSKYEDSDRLWLTRHGNPYRGSALKNLLDNLRDIAGIERKFSWYAIRHSTGTYMAREEGLAATQATLRHLSERPR